MLSLLLSPLMLPKLNTHIACAVRFQESQPLVHLGQQKDRRLDQSMQSWTHQRKRQRGCTPYCCRGKQSLRRLPQRLHVHPRQMTHNRCSRIGLHVGPPHRSRQDELGEAEGYSTQSFSKDTLGS